MSGLVLKPTVGPRRQPDISVVSIQRAKREDSAIADTDWSPAGVWQPSGTTDDADLDMEDHHIQRSLKGTGTSQNEVPDQGLDVVGSGGQALDYDLQQNLESKMGADFSDVRIHTGGKVADAADAIDPRAFTCGNDIVFNSGEYNPDSADGKFLLAHELAHVKQQTGDAPLSMMPKSDADLEIDPDPQLEWQADEAAKDALTGDQGPATVSRMGTDVHIQRLDTDDMFNALAVFETQNNAGEFRDTQNDRPYEFLMDEIMSYAETTGRMAEVDNKRRVSEMAEDPEIDDEDLTEQGQKW